MNIFKQIKLYREVKDYVIKNPQDVKMWAKMYPAYGEIDTSYEVKLNNLSLRSTKESRALGAKEYSVSVTNQNNDTDYFFEPVARFVYRMLQQAYNKQNKR